MSKYRDDVSQRLPVPVLTHNFNLDSSLRKVTFHPTMINLTPKQLRNAANIQEKIQSLQKQLGQLLGATVESAPGKAPSKPKKRRISAAGRKAIAAAAKARWAAIKAKKAKPVKEAKRKLSAAGRAALSAAAKARWAKVKKAGKSRL